MACECDYSYTCPECQNRIDIANQADYAEERFKWIVNSIKKLAEALKVELDEEPMERGRFDRYY